MIGEVNAKSCNVEPEQETQACPNDIHVGVFFDGTNNNANNYEFIDFFKITGLVSKKYVLNNSVGSIDGKLSNPAILSALFTKNKVSDDNTKRFIHAYIEGSGTNSIQAKNGAIDFLINGKPLVGLGCGMGATGVIAKVSKAMRIIGNEIIRISSDSSISIRSIHFYVFGFSRGSTCARLFSFLVSRTSDEQLPVLRDNNFDVESAFKKYLIGNKINYQTDKVSFLTGDEWKKIIGSPQISVDFLGIYDTVSAIGLLSKPKEDNVQASGKPNTFNIHYDNARRFGLYSPSSSSVLSTCHICAIDEYRANFALTDIGSASSHADNIEIFIPGCHSDIGGGYYKTDKVERKSIDFFKDGARSQLFNGSLIDADFDDLDNWVDVTYLSLKKMGWIVFEPQRMELISKLTDANTIEFDHQPIISDTKNIYSNLTLKYMYDRLKSKIEKFGCINFNELFNANIDDSRIIDNGGPLVEIRKYLSSLLDSSGRHWYIPNEEEYKELRSNYLHFTASDHLHSAGDVGNEFADVIKLQNNISKRKITRYVYRGGINEDSDIHYMCDYK